MKELETKLNNYKIANEKFIEVINKFTSLSKLTKKGKELVIDNLEKETSNLEVKTLLYDLVFQHEKHNQK